MPPTLYRSEPIKSAHQRRRSRFVHLDHNLARILTSLAQLLLKHGYGYSRVARLTKVAFVDAARSFGSKPSSKASIARVAALTGLTRVEVSRITKADRSIPANEDLNRATRVTVGWLTDAAYLDKRKRPRPLPFSVQGVGFGHLVRKYSGDIPARAMLAEMLRLGLVSLTPAGLISLIRDVPTVPSSAIATINAIAPWVNLVAEAGSSAVQSAMSSKTHQIRLHFNSLSEVIAATRELEGRQNSFVKGIQQLGTRQRDHGNYELTVSVAIATNRPLRSHSKKT